MYELCRSRSFLSILSIAMGLWLAVCGTGYATSWYMKPWKDIYRRVHPEIEPEWKSLDDAREWARNDGEVVEPVLLRILNSEYDDIPWTNGLLIAKEIPTEPVRDNLSRRLTAVMSGLADGCVESGTADGAAVVGIIDVLVHAKDPRVGAIAVALASKDCQPVIVVERCVEALQRVGDQQTIGQLARVPSRQRYVHIDRLCALAQKTIAARISGRDILRDADNELRAVTAKYLGALRSKDFAAYADAQPFAYRDVAKKEEVVREVFGNPQVEDVIRALAGVAGKEAFEIDRDNLEATLVVEGRYKFVYVLEVEGWKISGPTMIAP